MMDTARHPENVIDNRILANMDTARHPWIDKNTSGSGNNIEVYANGFREANTDGYSNNESDIYIYCAWGSRSFTTPFGINNEGRGWG